MSNVKHRFFVPILDNPDMYLDWLEENKISKTIWQLDTNILYTKFHNIPQLVIVIFDKSTSILFKLAFPQLRLYLEK